ncbi:MAG: hypothetical protein ACRD3P_07695 [Terriglobales bacterium]
MLGIGSLQFFIRNKPIRPAVPVVSVCKPLKSGMRRIGNQSGIQFDVSTSDLSIHDPVEDAPPFAHSVYLYRSHRKSYLGIFFGPLEFGQSTVADPDATFLTHLEKNKILDQTGRAIGEEYWGYLNSGERCRRVWLFKAGIVAKYAFVSKEDAEIFDRVIDSACLLP